MTQWRRWLGALMLLLAAALHPIPGDAASADRPPVFLVRIQGGIGPATAAEVKRSLQRAEREHAQLVVLEMDTPGGLDTAMRGIVQDILASSVPVAGYVAPSGARAASAGTYILYACHVAAMAPATNLGAATPVEMGMPGTGGGRAPEPRPADGASKPANHDDTMAAKRINDASAYLRGLAQLRGRNVAWAEQAVRESVSLAANDALAKKVIDLIATDVPDLLRQLDGRELTPGSPGAAPVKLATAGATVVTLESDWRARLLGVISDPSLALILMMIGIYGLLFEFMNPGFIAPGVIGGVALLLALWALQMLPINYAGIGLILLGVAFFAAEAFIPSYGALGLGGVAAFAFGALLLIDSDVPGFGIPLSLIGGLALVSAAFVIGVARMAVKARARPVRAGLSRLVGVTAEVIEFGGGEGWALVDGERWRICASQALRPGQLVRVSRAEGLTLQVGPLPGSPSTEVSTA